MARGLDLGDIGTWIGNPNRPAMAGGGGATSLVTTNLPHLRGDMSWANPNIKGLKAENMPRQGGRGLSQFGAATVLPPVEQTDTADAANASIKGLLSAVQQTAKQGVKQGIRQQAPTQRPQRAKAAPIGYGSPEQANRPAARSTTAPVNTLTRMVRGVY